MFGADVRKRLFVVSVAIIVVSISLFAISPVLLAKSLEFQWPVRAAATFMIILPLAFLLGIPFPSCIQLLALGHNDRYIPWMYGVNGAMSVLGSVIAAILSMIAGFTSTFLVGLLFYAIIAVLIPSNWKSIATGESRE